MASPKPSRKTKRENNAEIEGTLVLIKDPEHPNSDARLPALRLVAGGVVEFAKRLADAELRAFMERRIGTSLPEPTGDAAQAAAVAAAAPASAAGAAATPAAQAEAAMATEAETEDGTSSWPEGASSTETQGNDARDPVDTAAAMDVEDQPGSGSDTPGAAAAAAAAAEEEELELKQEATEEVMGPAQPELSERVEHVAGEAQAEVKKEEEELVVQGEAAADEDEDEGEEESDRELPAVTPKPYVPFLLVFTASSPTANFRIATIDQEGEGDGGGGGDGDGGGGGGEDEGKSGGGSGEVEKIAIEPFVWSARLVQLLMSVRDRCVRSTLRCACTSTHTCSPAGGDMRVLSRSFSSSRLCDVCCCLCAVTRAGTTQSVSRRSGRASISSTGRTHLQCAQKPSPRAAPGSATSRRVATARTTARTRVRRVRVRMRVRARV